MDHYKICTRCKQSLPATTEYFYKHGNGLFGPCKKCMRAASRLPDELKKRPPIIDGKQRCRCCGEWKLLDSDHFHPEKDVLTGFSCRCRECDKIKGNYREKHAANRPGERRCPDCETWYPLNREHFYESKGHHGGYANFCIQCSRKKLAERRRRKGLPEATRALIKDGMKRCTHCGNWYPETTEYFRKTKDSPDGLSASCISCKKFMHDNWVAHHPSENKRAYLRWYEKRGREYNRAWMQKNGRYRIKRLKRWTRQRSLPHDFTEKDWQFALEYFHNSCAVCGRPNGLFHRLSADHWIPMAKNGPTVKDNIVPLCFGIGGCNNKKRDLLPEEWLVSQYGRRKANTILGKIEEFFAVVRGRAILGP